LARGIHISTGEISNLSEEFLLRFYALHKRHVPQIRASFEKLGGVRLHLDGTGEAGNEIVFMAKEGETGITMDAQIIPTESKKYVKATANMSLPFRQKPWKTCFQREIRRVPKKRCGNANSKPTQKNESRY